MFSSPSLNIQPGTQPKSSTLESFSNNSYLLIFFIVVVMVVVSLHFEFGRRGLALAILTMPFDNAVM